MKGSHAQIMPFAIRWQQWMSIDYGSRIGYASMPGGDREEGKQRRRKFIIRSDDDAESIKRANDIS